MWRTKTISAYTQTITMQYDECVYNNCVRVSEFTIIYFIKFAVSRLKISYARYAVRFLITARPPGGFKGFANCFPIAVRRRVQQRTILYMPRASSLSKTRTRTGAATANILSRKTMKILLLYHARMTDILCGAG